MNKHTYYKSFRTKKELTRFKRLYMPQNAYKINVIKDYRCSNYIQYLHGYNLSYRLKK